MRGRERRAELLDVVHTGAGVLVAPMTEDRPAHLRRGGDRRRLRTRIRGESVIRDGPREIVAARGEEQRPRPAHTETDGRDATGDLGPSAEPVDRGGHVVAPFSEIEELRPRRRRVARRLAEGTLPEEILGCRRDVAGLRETAREV